MSEGKRIIDALLLDVVVRNDRVTPLNDSAVALIEKSVEETGVIRDPIHLRKVKGGYELIDGRHRLEVARRLGHDTISAQIWTCTLDQARLMEADANVTFTHMSPLDLAVSLSGRQRAYEKLHPETARGTFQGNQHISSPATEMSFTTFIAEIVGVTPRQIQRITSAGSRISTDDYRALSAAPNRVAMSDLYQVAKATSSQEQEYIVAELSAGTANNAAAARKAFSLKQNGQPPVVNDPVEVAFKALLTQWRRAPKAAKNRFVEAEATALRVLLAKFDGGVSE